MYPDLASLHRDDSRLCPQVVLAQSVNPLTNAQRQAS
jgi:hypothetical protein